METFHRHREPRTVETTHAKRDDTIRPKKPTLGGRIVQIALGLVGCHYINGAYGATPGHNDGASCRPGGVQLVADSKRLDPIKQADKKKDLAVLAAHTFIKDEKRHIERYCICGGNYQGFKGSFKGRPASPSDWDLNNYLNFPQRQASGGLDQLLRTLYPSPCLRASTRWRYRRQADMGTILPGHSPFRLYRVYQLLSVTKRRARKLSNLKSPSGARPTNP